MKCAVLGTGGFMGLHLCRGLLEAGHQVRAFDRSSAAYLEEARQWGAEIVAGDFLDPMDVRRAVAGCEAVFHLIWASIPETADSDPAKDVEANVLGTVRMLDEAAKAKVRKVIFASSGGTVYGVSGGKKLHENSPTRPITAYGIGKLAVENYLQLYWQLHGLDYGVLRIANAYGDKRLTSGGQGVVAAFLTAAVLGHKLKVRGEGTDVRDFIYIDDVIRAFVQVLLHEGEPRVFNVGTGSGTSINELISIMEAVVGRALPREYEATRSRDVPANVLDVSLARAELGWEPEVDLRVGIMRTYRRLQEEAEHADRSAGLTRRAFGFSIRGN